MGLRGLGVPHYPDPVVGYLTVSTSVNGEQPASVHALSFQLVVLYSPKAPRLFEVPYLSTWSIHSALRQTLGAAQEAFDPASVIADLKLFKPLGLFHCMAPFVGYSQILSQ